jgi:uncharacterized protein YihD (DUF1040 family)
MIARDKNRIKKILENLEKIWKVNPDLRLCQLLSILSKVDGNYKQNDLFYFEDLNLEIAIEKYKKIKNIL